jgi:hypothetical protein
MLHHLFCLPPSLLSSQAARRGARRTSLADDGAEDLSVPSSPLPAETLPEPTQPSSWYATPLHQASGGGSVRGLVAAARSTGGWRWPVEAADRGPGSDCGGRDPRRCGSREVGGGGGDCGVRWRGSRRIHWQDKGRGVHRRQRRTRRLTSNRVIHPSWRTWQSPTRPPRCVHCRYPFTAAWGRVGRRHYSCGGVLT